MPVQLTINPHERFMSVVATGEVTRGDIDGFIDAMLEKGALGYRKLFDASQATAAMDEADMAELGTRFRAIHLGADVGALALVMPPNRGDRLERMLGMIAAANRAMKVFTSVYKAQRWIEERA